MRLLSEFIRQTEANSKKTTKQVTLVLYGSVAVCFYFSDLSTIDNSSDIYKTDDVDVGVLTSLSEQEINRLRPPKATLSYQVRPFDNWLIHPEWEQACVNFSNLIGLKNWQVWALSPRDLILSKLIRYIRDDNERDAVDCARLAARYLSSKTAFAQDLEEALKYYGPYVTPSDLRRLRNVPDELFEF